MLSHFSHVRFFATPFFVLFYHFQPRQGFEDLEGYVLGVSTEKARKAQK